jgi:predicted outer membrane protein
MKNSYKKILGGFCCLTTAALLVSCSSSLSYNEALQKNISRIEDSEKLEDARFLVDAASYNMLAMEMANEAIKSGYSASLVTLAKENYEQHEEMGKELKKLARQEDVVLPAQMNDTHQKLMNELKSSDRREFDRNYIRILRDASQEDRGRFSQMATAAESEDIRAFAARKLDLFESHQTQFETVDAELLRTY